MAPTPHRIAQTSSEVKKQHKKNGPRIPERQLKQLERAHELDQRAARFRDAEERRKVAKKKREEREEKEERARKQLGVGLATQLIGYSRTQAQLKNGMEAFLGVKRRKEDEQRKKDLELTKQLEAIAQDMDNEPWDDEDDADDITLDLAERNVSSGEHWVDDDLDDDSLLAAHDMLVSDPVDEEIIAAPLPEVLLPIVRTSDVQVPPKDDSEFVRVHGPTIPTIETMLDGLPEDLIELLSLDLSLKSPEWNPSPSLLHKLNPLELPPHRLRVKVGCIVTVLRDLNTSSQLSRSQHLRILRAESDRLECLVLDGQLEGTKTFLTRVPFFARYKNQDQYAYQRTQFPIRVSTDYIPASLSRDVSQSGFKLPSIPGRVSNAHLPKKASNSVVKVKPQANQNPNFKLPGLPASKLTLPVASKPIDINKPPPPLFSTTLDGWDDFLESGTQIARELSAEASQLTARPSSAPVISSIPPADSIPPMSTQDFDFSLDDLDEEIRPKAVHKKAMKSLPIDSQKRPTITARNIVEPKPPESRASVPMPKPITPAGPITTKAPLMTTKQTRKTQERAASAPAIDLSTLRASQKPPSVSDRPGLKRKATTGPSTNYRPIPKRTCFPITSPAPLIKPVAVPKAPTLSNEFLMSTQDVASFFEDDDDFAFGSPPIPV